MAAAAAPPDPAYDQPIAPTRRAANRPLHVTNAIIYINRGAQYDQTEDALREARRQGRSIVCLLNVGDRDHALSLFAERLKLDPVFRHTHQIRDFMSPNGLWSRKGDQFAAELLAQIKEERLEETSEGETFLFRPPLTKIVKSDGTREPVAGLVEQFLSDVSQIALPQGCVVLIPLTFEDDAKWTQVSDWFEDVKRRGDINWDNLTLRRLPSPELIDANEMGGWAQRVADFVYPRHGPERGLNDDRENLRMMLLRVLDCDGVFMEENNTRIQTLRALKTHFDSALKGHERQ